MISWTKKVPGEKMDDAKHSKSWRMSLVNIEKIITD